MTTALAFVHGPWAMMGASRAVMPTAVGAGAVDPVIATAGKTVVPENAAGTLGVAASAKAAGPPLTANPAEQQIAATATSDLAQRTEFVTSSDYVTVPR